MTNRSYYIKRLLLGVLVGFTGYKLIQLFVSWQKQNIMLLRHKLENTSKAILVLKDNIAHVEYSETPVWKALPHLKDTKLGQLPLKFFSAEQILLEKEKHAMLIKASSLSTTTTAKVSFLGSISGFVKKLLSIVPLARQYCVQSIGNILSKRTKMSLLFDLSFVWVLGFIIYFSGRRLSVLLDKPRSIFGKLVSMRTLTLLLLSKCSYDIPSYVIKASKQLDEIEYKCIQTPVTKKCDVRRDVWKFVNIIRNMSPVELETVFIRPSYVDTVRDSLESPTESKQLFHNLINTATEISSSIGLFPLIPTTSEAAIYSVKLQTALSRLLSRMVYEALNDVNTHCPRTTALEWSVNARTSFKVHLRTAIVSLKVEQVLEPTLYVEGEGDNIVLNLVPNIVKTSFDVFNTEHKVNISNTGSIVSEVSPATIEKTIRVTGLKPDDLLPHIKSWLNSILLPRLDVSAQPIDDILMKYFEYPQTWFEYRDRRIAAVTSASGLTNPETPLLG